MKMKFSAMVALLAVFAISGPASAVTVAGSIEQVGIEGTTIDYYKVTTDLPGIVNFDVLARFIDFGDGPSLLQPHIFVFEHDDTGDLGFLGSLIAENNNDNLVNDTNGSTSLLDSFLAINLDGGMSVLAIAHSSIFTDESDIRAGFNSDALFGDAGNGDYEIDITGEFLLDVDPIDPPATGGVPEPITATLGLMGLGVLGMATRRRAALY